MIQITPKDLRDWKRSRRRNRRARRGIGEKKTVMISNLGNQWPYPRVGDARQAGSVAWFVVDERHANQLLECVPPIYPRGVPGFFVGEPAAHDDRGMPIHALIVQRNERYFMREVARDQALIAYGELLGLLKQLNIGRLASKARDLTPTAKIE